MSSVEAALKQELLTTKNSLTEVLDEVVYFEQQCARANERAAGVAKLLQSGQSAHRKALDAVLDYANRDRGASVADAATAHRRAQMALQRLSDETQRCNATLSTLGIPGGSEGWSLAGRHPDAVISPPSSSSSFSFGASPSQREQQHNQSSDYANIRAARVRAQHSCGAAGGTVAPYVVIRGLVGASAPLLCLQSVHAFCLFYFHNCQRQCE